MYRLLKSKCFTNYFSRLIEKQIYRFNTKKIIYHLIKLLNTILQKIRNLFDRTQKKTKFVNFFRTIPILFSTYEIENDYCNRLLLQI